MRVGDFREFAIDLTRVLTRTVDGLACLAWFVIFFVHAILAADKGGYEVSLNLMAIPVLLLMLIRLRVN